MGPRVGLDEVENIETSEHPVNQNPITRSMSPQLSHRSDKVSSTAHTHTHTHTHTIFVTRLIFAGPRRPADGSFSDTVARYNVTSVLVT
jgi:hypothetical protein